MQVILLYYMILQGYRAHLAYYNLMLQSKKG